MYYSRCHRKSAVKNEVICSDDFKWNGFRILKPDTGCRPKNLIKKPNQMPHHRIHFCHRSKTTVFDLWSSHFCIVLNITAGGHPVSSSTCTSLRAASGMTSARFECFHLENMAVTWQCRKIAPEVLLLVDLTQPRNLHLFHPCAHRRSRSGHTFVTQKRDLI